MIKKIPMGTYADEKYRDVHDIQQQKCLVPLPSHNLLERERLRDTSPRVANHLLAQTYSEVEEDAYEEELEADACHVDM